jgi:hydrogenase maturation protease
MLEANDAVILIDALPRGEEPGTVSLLELETNKLDKAGIESVNAHAMNPVALLQLVRSLGGSPRQIYLIGCEPAVLETEELGLSEKVKAAVPVALEMIRELVTKILHEHEETHTDGTGMEKRTQAPGSTG